LPAGRTTLYDFRTLQLKNWDGPAGAYQVHYFVVRATAGTTVWGDGGVVPAMLHFPYRSPAPNSHGPPDEIAYVDLNFAEVRYATIIDQTDQNGQAQTLACVHDAGGNLVFDGQFFYQFDGLNRLVQPNLAGALAAADFDALGRVAPGSAGKVGVGVWSFAYDGRSRLIRPTRYHPSGAAVRVEDYYDDGVRRV
jgi:hypothetical protein